MLTPVHRRIYAALGGDELINTSMQRLRQNTDQILNSQQYPISRLHWPLRWRHSGRDSVSDHQPRDCLLNHLFRRRSKKTSKLRVTGLCAGNSPGTDEFPAQMASKVFPFDDVIMETWVPRYNDTALYLIMAFTDRHFGHVEHLAFFQWIMASRNPLVCILEIVPWWNNRSGKLFCFTCDPYSFDGYVPYRKWNNFAHLFEAAWIRYDKQS